MNSSIWFANRMTHIKIVAVALLASSTVVVVGMSARMPEANSVGVWADIPIRADKPAFVAADTMSTTR